MANVTPCRGTDEEDRNGWRNGRSETGTKGDGGKEKEGLVIEEEGLLGRRQ